MKHFIKIIVALLILVLAISFVACDWSIAEEIIERLPYDLESWHEHSWDNWIIGYGEEEVSLVCSVCSETVKSYPTSQGLEIDENGVLVGRGECKDQYIIVPFGVTEIGEGAFENENDILGVFLPSTVTKIGDDAFKNCSGLQVINLPEGVVEIGDNAFSSCKSLIGIVIPNSVKKIGKMAFSNCGMLEIIYYVGTEEEWSNISKGKDWDKGAGKHVIDHKKPHNGNGGNSEKPGGNNPNGHKHKYETMITKPTCTEQGYTTYKCVECGKNYIDDYVYATGHDYTSVVTEPTCTEEGYTTYKCVECGKNYIGDYVDPNGHNYTAVITEPTCTERGYTTFDCDNCDYNYKDNYVKAKGHAWGDGVVTTEPTCTQTGVKTYTCHCNSTKEEILPREDHPFGEWIVLEESTHYTKGKQERHCTACGKVETEEIPKLYSQGLVYSYSSSYPNPGYMVVGMGTCTDKDIFIPEMYKGEPVVCVYRRAFEYKYSITSVVIPDSVLTIEDGAFHACSSLTRIVISASVKNIYGDPFSSCTALKNIEVDENNKHYKSENNVIYSKDGTRLIKYAPCKRDTSFTIPDSVNIIGAYAFSYCTSLKSIEIPDSVTSIGTYAFYDCYNLVIDELPSSITSIADYALDHCDIRGKKYDNALYLGNDDNPYHVLIEATNNEIISCQINENTKVIASHAFSFCESLSTIEIPASVTHINSSAFLGCDSLIEVCNKSSLNIVAGSIENGDVAKYAKHVITEESDSYFEYVGDFMFYDDGVDVYFIKYYGNETEITLPQYGDGKEYEIYMYAFARNKTITNVKIPNFVTSIGKYAFDECAALTGVELPDSITIINEWTFSQCKSLTNVKIPDSVTSIASNAFYYCKSLNSIEIPDSVTSIDETAFNSCDALEYNEHDNAYYLGNQDNPYAILFKAKNKTITSCKIHTDTRIISNRAFRGCSNLESLEISNSVTSIGADAFYACTALTNVVIPNSVTSIGGYAFYKCDLLTIYCEAESQPEEWDVNWNYSNRPVIWGYKGE